MSTSIYYKTAIANRLTLERLRKSISIKVGFTAAESMDILVYEDFVVGKIVEASFDVLGNKIHEDKESVYFYWDTPSSWWQHFKEDKMPMWFLKKYPTKFTKHSAKRTVTFKRYAEYPMANVAIPKDSRPESFYMNTLGGHETIRDEVSYV